VSEHYTPSVTKNDDGTLSLHWPADTADLVADLRWLHHESAVIRSVPTAWSRAADEIERLSAIVAAVERYCITLDQEGGPVCDTIARHLRELIHPEENR